MIKTHIIIRNVLTVSENEPPQTDIVLKVFVANNFWTRLRGLLGRKFDGKFDGLLLTPCADVHTIGMQYPIDIVFLNSTNEIIQISRNVPPGKLRVTAKKAKKVLELPAGTANDWNLMLTDLIIPCGAA